MMFIHYMLKNNYDYNDFIELFHNKKKDLLKNNELIKDYFEKLLNLKISK